MDVDLKLARARHPVPQNRAEPSGDGRREATLTR